MKKIASFGQGYHKVRFSWIGTDFKEYYIDYKTTNRTGIARIINKFMKSLKSLHKDLKTNSLQKLLKTKTTYGYYWIAAQCPKCKIISKKKNSSLTYTKEYRFNYLFKSFVTIQNIQRLLKKTN